MTVNCETQKAEVMSQLVVSRRIKQRLHVNKEIETGSTVML